MKSTARCFLQCRKRCPSELIKGMKKQGIIDSVVETDHVDNLRAVSRDRDAPVAAAKVHAVIRWNDGGPPHGGRVSWRQLAELSPTTFWSFAREFPCACLRSRRLRRRLNNPALAARTFASDRSAFRPIGRGGRASHEDMFDGPLDILERQRIVRLVVKEVLVGDDVIVIRHCIPVPKTPPQGDRPSCVETRGVPRLASGARPPCGTRRARRAWRSPHRRSVRVGSGTGFRGRRVGDSHEPLSLPAGGWHFCLARSNG